MNKRQLLKTVAILLLATVFTTISSLVGFAEEKDYHIGSAYWTENDATLIAEWDEAEDKTQYEFKLYKVLSRGNVIVKSLNRNGAYYDCTSVVLKEGTGKYFFTVKPTKGGEELKISSEIFTLESDYLRTMKKADEEAKKANDPYYTKPYDAMGNLKSVQLRTNETGLIDGQLRGLEIVSANNVKIQSVTFDKPFEQWSVGVKRRVTVVLTANDGYQFTDGTVFKGNLLTYVSNTGDAKTRTAVFTFIPRLRLIPISGIYIDNEDELRWDRVDNAGYYYLNLKDGNGEKIINEKVTTNHYNLGQYIDDIAELTIYPASKRDGYISAVKYEVKDFLSFRESAYVSGTFVRSDGRLRYRDESEEYVKSRWILLAGEWYHFNDRGYAENPGWFLDDDGRWYYFDEKYRMMVGKIVDKGMEYMLNDGSRTDLPYGAWIEKQVK